MSTLKILAIIGGVLSWISFCIFIARYDEKNTANAPTTKCSYVYGTKTREYALCVFEMKEHIRETP